MKKKSKTALSEPQKPLLVMAHKGEVQTFLQEMQPKVEQFPFGVIYHSSSMFMLICGEGMQNATEQTAAACSVKSGQISEIINAGVAGALDESVKVGEIVAVRTVYREQGNGFGYHSFTSSNKSAKIDCISAEKRVTDSQTALRLLPLAQIVDRELWAIASVAKLFKLPFRSFKLISDIPSQSVNCKDIIADAATFSEALFRYVMEQLDMDNKVQKSSYQVSLPQGFYTTFSQRKQLENLLTAICLKHHITADEVFRRVEIEAILQQSVLPKQRTALLIDALNELLNPFNAMLKAELARLCQPIEAVGGKIKFERDYESDAVELQIKISHPQQINKLCKALERWDFSAVQRLLNGDFESFKIQQEEKTNAV
jgi:nucleoside phosphorylase